MSALPRDLSRAVGALFALALVCLACAALYGNQYLFVGPLGESLPDVSPTDFELVLAFQLGAALCVLWAGALVTLATPSVAHRLTDGWTRASDREARAPRAWVLALGLAVLYTAGRFACNTETLHAPLAALTDGTALLPFQYRTLVPSAVRALVAGVPALGAVDLRWLYAPFEAAAGVGVWAAVAALLRALGMARGASRLAALGAFVPLAFNLVAPWRYNAIYFPYDTPSVAFFAAGLALLLRRAWWPYYALFAVATVNRETTCFLAVAWVALALGREPLARVAAHGAAQTALWGGVKLALASAYAANAPLDADGVGLFTSMVAQSARILTSVPGLAYLLVVAMGGLGAVALVVRGRIADARLRRLFWIVPPFLLGMAVVGELMEVRIYSELIPLATAGLCAAVGSVVRAAACAAPAPHEDTASAVAVA